MYTYERPTPAVQHDFTGCMIDEADTIKTFDYSSIHRSREFNEAMEYFDKEDKMTRAVLLSVNEADQNLVMTSLANKLYKHITDKVDDIDFGTIPNSRGDITKIDNYDGLVDCTNIIAEVLQQYHQDTKNVEIVSAALQNMIDRRDMFEKAYKLNIEMPIVIYNTIALSIVSGVSLIIASTIEFIKMPDDQGFNISVDRVSAVKTKDAVLYRDLEKFNRMCSDGSFDKAMDYVMKQNANNFAGAGFVFGVSSTVVILGILLSLIPLIRELIFFFYYSRSKASNYFDAQSSLLLINAANIENNLTRDEKKKKEIVAKQKKIAEIFKKISNTLKVETKTGEKKAESEINKLDSQKLKQDEVLDRIPDSSNSVLF